MAMSVAALLLYGGLFLLPAVMFAFYGFDDDDYVLRWCDFGCVCGLMVGEFTYKMKDDE
jgi:hypothetical protein